MRLNAALTKGGLKSLASQYVYVHIDLNKDQENAAAWRDEFSPQASGGIPRVHIVRWDGKSLYDKTGSIGKKILTEYLKPEHSGIRLSRAQLAKAKEIGDKAEKYLADGKIQKAVRAIVKFLGSNAAGEAVGRLDELGEKLAQQAKDNFKVGSEQLESEDEAIDGAIKILGTVQIYGKLPGVGKQLAKEAGKLRRKPGVGIYFKQAGEILRAQKLAAGTRKKSAIAAYKAIAKRYPQGRTAELANEALAELGEAAVVAPSASSVAASPTDDSAKGSDDEPVASAVSPADLAKAKSLYDSARKFRRSSPTLAKSYAQRAIKMAPGSEVAERAERLISRL